jgi:GNAT superfamily N-acetyltransferase
MVTRPHAGGIGMAAQRLTLGPDTLQTVAHDHVVLRTPSRPDYWSGNALDLFDTPYDLKSAFVRFQRTVGQLPGIERQIVAWERDAGPHDPGVDVPLDVQMETVEVGVLAPDHDVASPVIPDGVELVRASSDRHWAGARVLNLQVDRGGDDAFWRWHIDQQHQLVEDGSAAVLVAYQLGIPVGRAGLFLAHPGAAGVGEGLATIEDIIVHALYRRQGIARAMILALVDVARRLHPGVRVVIGSDPGSAASGLYAELGFVPTSWIHRAVRHV